jgi:predicted molibdopterin-dependent oxidoreductase YjgC
VVVWDTALVVTARKLAAIKAASGGDALAVLTSAKCTSEENYLVNKLARQVFGTNNLDHCARL